MTISFICRADMAGQHASTTYTTNCLNIAQIVRALCISIPLTFFFFFPPAVMVSMVKWFPELVAKEQPLRQSGAVLMSGL